MKLLLVATAAALGIESAIAHGYLASFIANGVTYPGWAPYSDPYVTPLPVRVERRIDDNGPVTDVSHINITCNKGGNVPTAAFAAVAAGSQVKFQWDQWGSSHSGPVMTYMARCPNGCASFKGDTGSPWFKIDHWGWDRTATPPWGSDRLAAQGASWTVTIPKSIANGEYLLICLLFTHPHPPSLIVLLRGYRHEILGLHVAATLNGAQFYPHCVQVRITGGGSATPSGVALPGVYKATEPGILTQLWWYSSSNASASYTIPGGPVWSG